MDYYRDQRVYPQGDRMLIQKQVFSQKGVHLCGCKSNIYHSPPPLFCSSKSNCRRYRLLDAVMHT